MITEVKLREQTFQTKSFIEKEKDCGEQGAHW
jgi:hypothetical protein